MKTSSMLQAHKTKTAYTDIKMTLLPVIELLDYNLFILKTARMTTQVLQGWQDIIWQDRCKWPWLLWGCACWEIAQELNADHRAHGRTGWWAPSALSCGLWGERWFIIRDVNLANIQRAQAVSAKMSLKCFVIIDSNLLIPKVLSLAKDNSVFDLLLMGKEER